MRRHTPTLLAALLLASCAGNSPREVAVTDRIAQYAPAVSARLAPSFAAAGIAWPPQELAYLAFKDRSTLEVYARNKDSGAWTYVRSYPVLGASGHYGPKLAEGDRQVPEGLYEVDWLNPNSRSHLSLHLNYPNAFDELAAQRDGRIKLGHDIAIHGGSQSIGCLAMGDEAAEDLFVLSALVAWPSIRVLISPTDFRGATTTPLPQTPPWTAELYERLRTELKQFPKSSSQ